MKTLIATASVLALTISSADAAARQPRRAPFEEAFFVAMLVGEPDQVIAANGPLEFSVRSVMSGAATRIQLLMQSSVDDWSATWVGPNLLAGEVLFAQATNTIDPAFEAPGGPNGASAMAPDGAVLAVAADTLTIALNLYDHDCIAAGVVTTIRGSLEP
jgi:hypothetical protein